MLGKIADKNINSFLNKPSDDVNSMLFYGSDESVIFYRFNLLKKAYQIDGYQIIQISCETEQNAMSIAKNEALSQDFFTSKKAIFITGIKDKQFLEIKDIIEDLKDCKIAFTANGITKASKIKIFHEEESQKTASIACYPLEKQDCKMHISEILKQNNISYEDENLLDVLAENIGQNPMEIDNELSKILILCEKTKLLTRRDVELISSISEDCSFDLIDAFFSKKISNITKYVAQCEINDVNSVLIARGMYKYACKLLNSQINIKNGSNQAMEAKINGIFFKKYNIFYQHLKTWSPKDLEKLIIKLFYFDRNTRLQAKILPEILNLLR